jgi:trafficking protein particle complex subunit 12
MKSFVFLIPLSNLLAQEFRAATSLLEPLCHQVEGIDPILESAIARVYLQGGHIAMASKHLGSVAANEKADPAAKRVNAALLASAEGRWDEASQILQSLCAEDAENFVVSDLNACRLDVLKAAQAANNLAVALLNQGKLKEVGVTAYHVLNALTFKRPSMYQRRLWLYHHRVWSLQSRICLICVFIRFPSFVLIPY